MAITRPPVDGLLSPIFNHSALTAVGELRGQYIAGSAV